MYNNIVLTNFEDSLDEVGIGFWRAPKVLQALKDNKDMISTIYTSKTNVYSFGMTCYKIMIGLILLDNHLKSIYDMILLQNRCPKLPSNINPKLRKLLCQCWHHDLYSRPTSSLQIVLQLQHLVEEDESLSCILVHLTYNEYLKGSKLTSNPL